MTVTDVVTLALCGDVMLGRGIDQALPDPGDPQLWERHVGDARHYVDLHWGSNWGHQVPPSHRTFAHALVDGGVDVVHGHSSHHPRPVEVHAGRLILYGCGDLVNDYEGIGGHEACRSHLRLLHLVSVDATTGALVDTRLVPLEARRLRLEHASAADTRWLATTLDDASRLLGTGVEHAPDGHLRVVPAGRGTRTDR